MLLAGAWTDAAWIAGLVMVVITIGTIVGVLAAVCAHRRANADSVPADRPPWCPSERSPSWRDEVPPVGA